MDAARLAAMSDGALLEEQSALVAQRRRVDAALASVAGEIARRSSREAGFAGLAQRHGHRSAEDFIATATGLSRRETGALVRVATAAAGGGTPSIASAVGAGTVSVAAADAIMRGLGAASPQLGADALDAAAATLLEAAGDAAPEELVGTARELRALLDADSVSDRERELRGRRSLRMFRQDDGMTRLTALLDPESAAQVRAVCDALTAPRRGGPRFVDAGDIDRARRLEQDPRTTEQLALDGIVELLRIGAEVAPASLIGSRRPAVRIHVRDADLRARGMAGAGLGVGVGGTPAGTGAVTGRTVDGAGMTIAGAGRIEGEAVPISLATVERHICAAGTVPIHFDSAGQVVNVGREHRLYTHRQRIGLAARDGGCRWPGCDRPPSWCEAHHIDEWHAHDGRTDLADGILLCRFHHLMVHDRGWRIRRGRGEESARYWAERDAPPGRRRSDERDGSHGSHGSEGSEGSEGSDDPPMRSRPVASRDRPERIELVPRARLLAS